MEEEGWLVDLALAGPRRARRGGYGRVALCSTENRGAAALELATLARAGLRRSGEAVDGHGKAREARILQIRWRLACGGRRRATQPWKLLLSEEKRQRSSEGKQGKKRDRRDMVGARRPEENLRFGSEEARKRAGPAASDQGGDEVGRPRGRTAAEAGAPWAAALDLALASSLMQRKQGAAALDRKAAAGAGEAGGLG